MRRAADLQYSGYASVLLRYPSAYSEGPGEVALWVRDDYAAGKSATPGVYSLHDINSGVPLADDDDIDRLVAGWRNAVGWDR